MAGPPAQAAPTAKVAARTMYIDETPKQEIDAARAAFRDRGAGRPTKRDRRELDKFKR